MKVSWILPSPFSAFIEMAMLFFPFYSIDMGTTL